MPPSLFSPRDKLERLVPSHRAALLLSATSQGNMKTETQVVRGPFVWERGAVVRGKPTANLRTKELPVPFYGGRQWFVFYPNAAKKKKVFFRPSPWIWDVCRQTNLVSSIDWSRKTQLESRWCWRSDKFRPVLMFSQWYWTFHCALICKPVCVYTPDCK